MTSTSKYNNPWKQWEIDFIKANYRTLTKPEILKALNDKGANRTYGSLKYLYRREKLVSGIDCKFAPGTIPPLKGKKISEETRRKMKRYFFPKGHRPHNAVEVGTEVIVQDGYIKVKIAEPNKWRFKHHIIWERYNGVIPKGNKVIFLDGNRLNCSIENLSLISNANELELNQKFKISSSPEEKKVQIDIVKLNSKLRKLK